jgi:hypothetical protein
MLGGYIGQSQLMRVARELARYKLDSVGLQEVRCDTWNTVRAGDCIFSMENETNSSVAKGIFCTPQKSISS